MKNTQKGVGLVEVLVSLLLLAIGVLGFMLLQLNALKATGESVERTQSLVLMREVAEKIRVNPTAIEVYQTKINTPESSITKNCASQACTPEELAAYDAYQITEQVSQYGFKLGLHYCPGTGGTGAVASRATYSYCLVSAWGDTEPEYGDDSNTDCLNSENGSYYPKATCMFMEIT